MSDKKTERKLEIVYISREKLYKLPGNPRKTKDKGRIERLKAQITAHGFQVPIQVYKEGNGFTVLCGNHRLEAGGSLGMEEMPCIIYEGTKQDAIARAIADNKTNEWTEWDMPNLGDMLGNLDDGTFDMFKTGFTQQELAAVFGGPLEDPFSDGGGSDGGGDVKFSEILGEANNYVVLAFRNEVDWIAAKTHFGIGQASSYRTNGKAWSIGIGRVIDGAKYIKAMFDGDKMQADETTIPDPFAK